jgi:hypothetical protein
MSSEKLTEQVNVKLTPQELHDINEIIISVNNIDLNNGKLLRFAWKYFKRYMDEHGALGLLLKLLDE